MFESRGTARHWRTTPPESARNEGDLQLARSARDSGAAGERAQLTQFRNAYRSGRPRAPGIGTSSRGTLPGRRGRLSHVSSPKTANGVKTKSATTRTETGAALRAQQGGTSPCWAAWLHSTSVELGAMAMPAIPAV